MPQVRLQSQPFPRSSANKGPFEPLRKFCLMTKVPPNQELGNCTSCYSVEETFQNTHERSPPGYSTDLEIKNRAQASNSRPFTLRERRVYKLRRRGSGTRDLRTKFSCLTIIRAISSSETPVDLLMPATVRKSQFRSDKASNTFSSLGPETSCIHLGLLRSLRAWAFLLSIGALLGCLLSPTWGPSTASWT